MQAQGQQFKVMGFTFEFCVISTSPLPLEGYSITFGEMFILLRQCAEPMIQLCRLNVKVTVKGHGINS